MNNPRRPIPECYWVLPGRFLAGEYPSHTSEAGARQRLASLLEAGIDTFIDLTCPGELPAYQGLLMEEAAAAGLEVTHKRFPIRDFDLPSPELMRAALDAIDEALAGGHRVYLHCRGGIGRTGTTVGCHLVRHGRTGPEAVRQLAEWWRGVPKSLFNPHSPETEEQLDFILGWNELA